MKQILILINKEPVKIFFAKSSELQRKLHYVRDVAGAMYNGIKKIEIKVTDFDPNQIPVSLIPNN